MEVVLGVHRISPSWSNAVRDASEVGRDGIGVGVGGRGEDGVVDHQWAVLEGGVGYQTVRGDLEARESEVGYWGGAEGVPHHFLRKSRPQSGWREFGTPAWGTG